MKYMDPQERQLQLLNVLQEDQVKLHQELCRLRAENSKLHKKVNMLGACMMKQPAAAMSSCAKWKINKYCKFQA